MNTRLPGYLDLLRAERLKLRRSLILGLALLFPLGLLTIALLVGFLVLAPTDHATWRHWMAFTLVPWSNFLLPMLICLLASLLLNLEHQNQAWKHLHALPVARWKHLAAKQATLAALLLLGHAILFLGFWLGGWLLRAWRPALRLEAPSPAQAASLLGMLFLASLAMAAAHLWLAARFANLGVNLGVGFGAVALMVVVAQRPAMARCFPWSLPGMTLSAWLGGGGTPAWSALGASLALGAVLVALACWDAQRRESEG